MANVSMALARAMGVSLEMLNNGDLIEMVQTKACVEE